MRDRLFFDSNILLYLFMNQDYRKNQIAAELIKEGGFISYQVINEVSLNLIKKASYSEAETESSVKLMFDYFEIADFSKSQILLASQIRSQFKISFWDSIILSSSVSASCSKLYSEDMQSGLTIMGTQIINPFI